MNNAIEDQRVQPCKLGKCNNIRLCHKVTSTPFVLACTNCSGEYDPALKEWCVHSLKRNHIDVPFAKLKDLQLRIGENFRCDFSGSAREMQRVHVRLFRSPRGSDTSFIFIFQEQQIMILGRAQNQIDTREEYHDREFDGNLDQVLALENMDDISLVFSSFIFKEHILSNELRRDPNGNEISSIYSCKESFREGFD